MESPGLESGLFLTALKTCCIMPQYLLDAAKCKAFFFFFFSEKGNLKVSLGKEVTGDFGFLFLVFGLTLFLFFYCWHGCLCLVSHLMAPR